ncbi:MAG: hypothetical protein CFH07_01686 [Alphaproteobacteria bacterium MarineAlpha3_Bin6]|nr:MAG: hypothetical protein CFH07_01686 [Alphaproteobacteria bacterium MarineAlpha3_Bin6]
MANDYPDFSSLDFPKTLVLYGQCSNPVTTFKNISIPPGDNAFELSRNYAVLSPSSPGLRFSSSGWLEISTRQMLNVQSTESLFQICRERIISRTSQFSALLRLFLESYFDFLHSQIEKHKNELEPDNVEDEIFIYKDWIFSAWLPLPQAHILLPPEFMDNKPSFAEIDLAFWIEGQLIGVIIDGGETPIKSRQKKLDYLVEKHPQLWVIKVPRDKLEEDTFPIDLFPNSFSYFWRTLTLPRGPFTPKELINKRWKSDSE